MLPFDEIEQITAPAQRKAYKAQNKITARMIELIALYCHKASVGDFRSALAAEQEFERYYGDTMQEFLAYAPATVSETVIDYAEQSYMSNADKIGVPFNANVPVYSVAVENAEKAVDAIGAISPGTTGIAVRTPSGMQFTLTTDFFRRELNGGITQVASGNKTYVQVIRDVVQKMSNSGVRAITYEMRDARGVKTGKFRTDRIDVITRRAIMAGIKDTITTNAYEVARQTGTTFFEISLHDGARETHWWGGYRFSTMPTNVIDTQTGKPFVTDEYLIELSGAWLTDWNCRHYITPIDNKDRPLYNADEIKAHQAAEKQTTPYKGREFTRYQATQHMRAMEREMRVLRQEGMLHKAAYNELRKTNTAAALADLEEPYTEARLKYRALRAEYSEFARAMRLKTEFERVSYDMLGRVF